VLPTAGTKNEAGPTRWFALKGLHMPPTSRDGGNFGFDLDGRVTCDALVSGCLSKGGFRRTDDIGGVDNALPKGLLSELSLIADTNFTLDVGYTLLLRIDDAGTDDDASAPGALYVARKLEGDPKHATWTSDDRWIVDSSSLEDGTSLDRPRWRLPNGFVSAGQWWSGGIDTTSIPVELTDRLFIMTTIPLPVRLRVATIGLVGSHGGILAGFIRADEAKTIADAWRGYGRCASMEGKQPADLILADADLVADAPDLQRDGVPCDAVSLGIGFDAVPTATPTKVATHVPSPLYSIDTCATDRGPRCLSPSTDPEAGGPVHGVRPDGRVDVSAADAWPDRPTEPPLPTGADLARACATLAACLYVDDLNRLAAPVSDLRKYFAHDCANPTLYPAGSTLFDTTHREEEHGIPIEGLNERLSWLLQVALDSKGDCDKVRAARTARQSGLDCASEGCAWRSSCGLLSSVRCAGSVATIDLGGGRSYMRDCAHTFTSCDSKSHTGCKDRPLVRCDPAGGDRCDGAIHLGCRSIGYVSLRDCSRYGGTCKEVGSMLANCDYPYSDCNELPSCSGSTLNICTLGKIETVDCIALGFTGCDGGRCYR